MVAEKDMRSARKGNRYQREIRPGVFVDVYDVLVAFTVTCPATAHAVKKLLVPGNRGHKDLDTDLREAIVSIERARQLAEFPIAFSPSTDDQAI